MVPLGTPEKMQQAACASGKIPSRRLFSSELIKIYDNVGFFSFQALAAIIMVHCWFPPIVTLLCGYHLANQLSFYHQCSLWTLLENPLPYLQQQKWYRWIPREPSLSNNVTVSNGVPGELSLSISPACIMRERMNADCFTETASHGVVRT